MKKAHTGRALEDYRMKIFLPLCFAAFIAGAGPSLAAETKAAPSCFRMSQVHNHTVADAHTLYLGVNQHDVYRVTASNGCLAAKDASDPLITRTMGSDLICRPIDLDLRIGGMGGEVPCIVSKIEKLTLGEAAALPKKLRP